MQLGNRNSQHSFAQIPDVKMARSQFDRSFTAKDTFNFDYLTPIFVDEVIPGDTANVTLSTFARLSSFALKNPIMDNMYIDFFFFFVPNRLVWDNWEKFNGAQTDPGDSTDFLIPTITSTAVTGEAVGTIYDKMGIPTQVPNLEFNALPFRAYNLIYNEWFRDQNMQNSLAVPKDNGPDLPNEYTLVKSGKRHDYFTACLPWPQKGDAVTIPLGTMANIHSFNGNGSKVSVYADSDADYRNLRDNTAGGVNTIILSNADTPVASDRLYADLSTATAATINQLREAFSVQSLLELDARGGSRYVEILQNHFQVVSPDFRLQRPEYLGGGSQRINSNVVTQTSPTSGSNALGQVAAFGTSSNQGTNIGFTKSFVEHGYIIGLARARADLTYQQGLHRMWSRSTRFDFFWPKLQELGEQAVLRKEIYATGSPANDDVVFGYQERFAEYRYSPSQIRGEFRSTYATSLDSWHLAEEFGSAPSLNSTFIESSTPIDRALAITTGPDLLMDMWFNFKNARPMLTYSVPSNLGRF